MAKANKVKYLVTVLDDNYIMADINQFDDLDQVKEFCKELAEENTEPDFFSEQVSVYETTAVYSVKSKHTVDLVKSSF